MTEDESLKQFMNTLNSEQLDMFLIWFNIFKTEFFRQYNENNQTKNN